MYKCIFFDLDHTLWDYETNSRETLTDLYCRFALKDRGVNDVDDFSHTFKDVNERLWDLYDRGLIDSEYIRRERFKQILEKFNAHEEELSARLSHEYLLDCPKRGMLMPHAIETLQYLSDRYDLTVVTNGFDEIQHTKLSTSNLLHYFDHVVTSQKAGFKKPAREIFEYALRSNAIQAYEAMMVGDNLITDIGGARNASIDVTFFNPFEMEHEENVHYEIKSLRELCDLL
ncbi:MAG TPA: YjjG family noncanonical pyrimidine nucleotidase [Cyclobacteriaceae bacterium]|nr:YjjG family noncanonical pyrimidine nucleotidase [Cyclobacteriaceae bacterium]